MKPSSAKAKGRRFQQQVRDLLLERAPHLEQDDIRSTSMGASGEDLLLSPLARKTYPLSIECKNTEKLNVWDAIKQAKENCGNHIPAVCFTRNREDAYIALPLNDFLTLLESYRQLKTDDPV